MTDTTLYFGNVLQSFDMGMQMDWRARYATELMKAHPGLSPRDAIDQATEFLDLCETRGLIKALPETDELSSPLRRHIRRSIRAQIYQQVAGQEIAQEEQKQVQPIRGVVPGLSS